jgi:hypothetical protein
MADFQQNVVPTFTRLVDEDLGRMEKKILRAARHVPIGVICETLMSAKLTVDEMAARGGKSRSDKKLEACRRNLKLAKAAQTAKRAERRCSAAPAS